MASARTRPLAVTLGLALLLLAAPAAHGQAGAVVIYENGSPDMGSAYAGAGARASDAATSFSNPAGMTRLEGNQLLLGTFGVFILSEFDLNESNTVSVPAGNTNDGGDLNQFAPGLGSFGVLEITDDLRFGFSINALAAAGVDYDDQWVGRTFVTENSLLVANIAPSLAYRVNDWLSIGAGFNLVYGKLDQRFKANSLPDAPTVRINDADDWAINGTVGVLLEPVEGTRVGVVYRSELSLELSGEVDNPTPRRVNFDNKMNFAQGVNVSVYHRLHPKFALLADAGWSDWSRFGRQPTTIGPQSFTINRNWKDTWRIGIGGEYDFAEDWKVRAGFSFDSSPVDSDDTWPDIPVGDQYRFSAGIQHDFGHGKVMALSLTALYQDVEIDRVALPPTGDVVLDGDYDPNWLFFLGMTLSVTF